MARFVVLVCVVWASSRTVSADTYYMYNPRGVCYQVSATAEEMEATPSWTEDAENPPLSARRALALATAKQERLAKVVAKFDDVWTWRLGGISLRQYQGDKWYWLVTFEASHRQGLEGVPPTLQLMVLMDGRVPEPVVAGPR